MAGGTLDAEPAWAGAVNLFYSGTSAQTIGAGNEFPVTAPGYLYAYLSIIQMECTSIRILR